MSESTNCQLTPSEEENADNTSPRRSNFSHEGASLEPDVLNVGHPASTRRSNATPLFLSAQMNACAASAVSDPRIIRPTVVGGLRSFTSTR